MSRTRGGVSEIIRRAVVGSTCHLDEGLACHVVGDYLFCCSLKRDSVYAETPDSSLRLFENRIRYSYLVCKLEARSLHGPRLDTTHCVRLLALDYESKKGSLFLNLFTATVI